MIFSTAQSQLLFYERWRVEKVHHDCRFLNFLHSFILLLFVIRINGHRIIIGQISLPSETPLASFSDLRSPEVLTLRSLLIMSQWSISLFLKRLFFYHLTIFWTIDLNDHWIDLVHLEIQRISCPLISSKLL